MIDLNGIIDCDSYHKTEVRKKGASYRFVRGIHFYGQDRGIYKNSVKKRNRNLQQIPIPWAKERTPHSFLLVSEGKLKHL